MRVHIFKGEREELSVMVEPSAGKGLPPVVLQGLTEKDVADKVKPIIDDLRRPRQPLQE